MNKTFMNQNHPWMDVSYLLMKLSWMKKMIEDFLPIEVIYK